jgi:hypothetical protein
MGEFCCNLFLKVKRTNEDPRRVSPSDAIEVIRSFV